MGYVGLAAIYGLFLVSTVVNKFLMGPVVSLVVKQEQQEGNFRWSVSSGDLNSRWQ